MCSALSRLLEESYQRFPGIQRLAGLSDSLLNHDSELAGFDDLEHSAVDANDDDVSATGGEVRGARCQV